MNKLIGNKVLTKVYQGKTYRATIKDGTVTLKAKGKKFRSLSGAAEAITGHPTSGRYFWGTAK